MRKSPPPSLKFDDPAEDEGIAVNDGKEYNEAEREDRSMEIVQAKYHFLQAEVDEEIYFSDDVAHFKAADGKENYTCKIVELF